MLRQRHKDREAIEIVKSFDAFPKTEEDFQEISSARGTISILIFLLISVLVVFEFLYYSQNEIHYNYNVDFDHDSKMKFIIDITIATPCGSIGADVLDSTSSDMLTDQKLNEEETWFELSPIQQKYRNYIVEQNKMISDDYHSIHQMLWLNKYREAKLPNRESEFDRPKDACRLYGQLELTKVSGNFHIIAGKSISFFGNHAHLSPIFDTTNYNYSHRIDHFSIGEEVPGIFYPLNSELKITESSRHIYQYFIQAVPTEIHLNDMDADTYQYAVTEQERVIDHQNGSHGLPGIFFKYDISSLKIQIKETHKSYLEFLIRIIGIVGGVFATTMLFNSAFESATEFICAYLCLTPFSSQQKKRYSK